MDAEPGIGAALLVHQRLIAERRIPYHRVKELRGDFKVLEPGALGDLRFGVERGYQFAGERIQFNAMQLRSVAQLTRHQAKEVTGPNRRLQHAATGEPQPSHGVVHGANGNGAGVVRVQCGPARGLELGFGQQLL